MTSLIVVSHADRDSLTHHLAQTVAESIRDAGGIVEIADLAAERFDPRFGEADLELYRRRGPTPADVVAEQQRIDRAEHLVLVFPMYWWSMPALLKGWIDRVFVRDWAFDDSSGSASFGLLERLTVDLVIVAGDEEASFARHGIPQSIRTQIEQGIFGYSGAKHGATHYVFESDTADPLSLTARVRDLGTTIAARTTEVERADVSS